MFVRRLHLEENGKSEELRVVIGPPRPQTHGSSCDLTIRGGSLDIAMRCRGHDDFQALEMAFVAIRKHLDPLGDAVSYLGLKGWTGVPKIIPFGLSLDLAERCEALVDDAYEDITDETGAQPRASEARKRGPDLGTHV